MVEFGQNGCIRDKVVVFAQKWLYSDKSGFTRVKVIVFGQNWLYSGKRCCSRA